MSKLFDKLSKDIRFKDGLNACISCGVCTAICPAAAFYKYSPRLIMTTVQTKDEKKIDDLLNEDTVWYCGECMSCKTRCPRKNVPGLVIEALRSLSQELGHFTESEKGRQQFAIKRTVGEEILKYGYCVHPDAAIYEMHPEQGPVWEWYTENLSVMVDRLGGNYNKEGAGALRKMSEKTMDELNKIFDVSGGSERFENIEKYSKKKAKELGWEFKDEGIDNEYFTHTFCDNNNKHTK
ncbi:MAG: 4Fe-4S dicluster domain-containing protein [Bacteroidales bacterium]|nr:4Fe-4S dicluster domain-containing protein [Bacteroidales bacterium]